jgi:hypothetical protein
MKERGRARIEFDFEFEYSANGEFHRASAIELRAPGRGQIGVHNRMTAWVSSAMVSLAKAQSDLKGMLDSIDSDEAAEKVDEGGGAGMLTTLAMGLNPEKYDEFVSYVMKALTNSPLAVVAGSEARITDAVWDSIEAEGGLEAVMEIIGTFAGFFGFSGKRWTRANGTGLSATSA